MPSSAVVGDGAAAAAAAPAEAAAKIPKESKGSRMCEQCRKHRAKVRVAMGDRKLLCCRSCVDELRKAKKKGANQSEKQ